MEKIAVILPVRNGANYLEQSISSVLSQQFEDFSLHILDDGSTDATPNIVRSIKDPRVNYSRNPVPFGLFRTLNRGFSEAQAELVRLWAHDDVMLPHCLGTFYESALRWPDAGMYYCDFHATDSAGTRTGLEQLYIAQRSHTPDVADARTSAALLFCFGCLPGNISTVMLRRSAWGEAGGFIEGLQQAPDYDMWLRISQFRSIAFIRTKLMELRDHPLQLGKVGHRQMASIAEELPIFNALRRQLAECLPDDALIGFWRQHRGRQHMHWIARALLRGDVNTARRGWRYLAAYGAQWRQLLMWLGTANGRFLSVAPEDFFERLMVKVQASVTR